MIQRFWDWFWHPPGTHAIRWRTTATWIVIFTILVAWSLQLQRNESRRNDHRFCKVVDGFITANLKLQNAQAKSTIQTIGLREQLSKADRQMIGVLKVALDHPTTTVNRQAVPFLGAWLASLRADLKVNQQIIASSQKVQTARNKANDTVRMLRQELRCGF